jgi:hypothetical protein
MHLRTRFVLHRRTLSPRSLSGLVALSLFLLMTSSAPAQRLPLPPNEQEEVNNAIDGGVAFLKRTQQKNGTWVDPHGNWAEARVHGHIYAIGFTALPALTLLECGVPATDPIVQQAAQFVRSRAAQLDRTYELSLAVLFLDRLGDPKDKKIIQTFALRLIAGQSSTGGWGYKCPILGSKTQVDLMTALRRLDPQEDMPGLAVRRGKKPDDLRPLARVPDSRKLEAEVISRGSPGETSSLSRSTLQDSAEDSTTLNESVALSPDECRDCLGWGILDEKNPELLEPDPKEKDGQNPTPAKPDAKADARKPTKSYAIPERIKMLPVAQDPEMHVLQDPLGRSGVPYLTTTDNSNTQFAILALWRAQQYDVPTKRSLNLIVRRYVSSQNADGSWGYHYQYGGGAGAIQFPNSMICVGLIGLAVGHGLGKARPAGQPAQDARIINGLIALSANIGQPVENRGMLSMQNLYFLWSLERVAVLYNLPMIGDKDWYRWGAQVLVRNQQSEGHWAGGLYVGSKPTIDTCLALLFLKRANLVKDLTAKLPFSAEDLNNSIMEKLSPPKRTEPPKQTKKASAPIEPPKPKELEKVAASSPPSVENTSVTDSSISDTGSNKKKWLIASVVLFLAFSGGSLVLILLAMNRGKEEDGEAKQEKKKKRTVSRDPKGSAKPPRSPSARG